MNRVYWDTHLEYELDKEHNAVVLALKGNIKSYDPGKPRLRIFGEDAIKLGMNLLLDLRRYESVPSLMDLFDVANDLIELYQINPEFKMGVVTANQMHEGIIKTLRAFSHSAKDHIRDSRDTAKLHEWLMSC